MDINKPVNWSHQKNQEIKLKRGLSFEEIETAILNKKVLEVIDHSSSKYSHQKIFVIDWDDYVVLVPYVETADEIFLKTAFHNRKATKKYLKQERKSHGHKTKS